MWGCINKIYSLEEKASAQVAINLCQGNDFKEVALRLEKPTYGGFISQYAPSFFVSDSDKLSMWAKVKEDDQLCSDFMRSCCLSDAEEVRRWDTAVDEQCQRLTEEIPLTDRLKQKIYPWMNRIAMEFLSYSRRQEVLFGVSRYFLMDIFTRGDWKEAARLDEEKLAQRLLEDERLTVLQRYRIACVYCLHIHIPQLWERFNKGEKKFINGYRKHGEETNSLVLLCSMYMEAKPEEKIEWRKDYLWAAVSEAMSYGNHAALMVCWKEFQEDIWQKDLFLYRALQSLQQWQSIDEFHVKKSLVLHQSPEEQSADSMKHFNLPSHYSQIMFFLLSQTDEEQQLTFFKTAFQCCNQNQLRKSVLEYFLDWPHQDNFLPMINRLWGIIPKYKYLECLLVLASKYSKNNTKANCYHDYRSLLTRLWVETPEEYKQYVFCDRKTHYSVINEGEKLLSRLLERSPFQEKDEALFKRIFRDQPREKRRAMMLSKWGENMCLLLMQKEKWSFLNGLLEECLSKEEIPDFKKRFIQSDCGVKLCLDELKENRVKLLKDLLNWSLESNAEIMQHKNKLIENNDCLDACQSLLLKGKFADVEHMINFCLSSDAKKEQFKVHFAQCACSVLLRDYTHDSLSEDCVWEQMDTIIAWSVDTKEKVRDFKKDLFSREGINVHHVLVVVKTLQVKIKCFYQWFGLSPEEIKQLKKDTLFTPRFIKYIHENLLEYTTNKLVDTLHLCLTNEEMVIDLKKEVEESFTDFLDVIREMKKEILDHLVSKLLDGFRNEEVLDKTGKEGIFVKDTADKGYSAGIKDESIPPSKRRK